MGKRFWERSKRLTIWMGILILGGLWIVSCDDDYYYDEREPEWLGASIYDYLKSDGDFTIYTALIDDLQESDGYRDVLGKTGSKTLFVANDSAFNDFFSNNPWGVTSYDGLSLAQKRLLLKFGMLDNAYLIETLANYNYYGTLVYGTALRRTTSVSPIDTVPYEYGDMLPSTPYWDRFKDQGIHVLKDAGVPTMIHFLPNGLTNAGISDADFKLITGMERSGKDAFIFDNKVIERDITCKNGYVHVLQSVMIPRVNVAEHVSTGDETEIFSELLERFCAPYYNGTQTLSYNENNPDAPIDSIFEKVYFSSAGDGRSVYPDGSAINSTLLLPFNPGKNDYVSSTQGSALQSDMATILAPSDAAMLSYLESGSGLVIKERYGSWDNVPDDIAILFLKRHLRESFLGTVPVRFSTMNDSENSPIVVDEDDISSTYLGTNGVVYHTNTVYPPDDYVSVYGPVLFSEKTRVFNWAINQNDFRLYLNSLVSRYSFFVPTDEYFKDYIDPIAYAKDVKAVLKYWYNYDTEDVNATVYAYDAVNDIIGDSIDVIENTSFIQYRLLDLLDSHIVIGDVEGSDSTYFFTKNGNVLKVEGSGQNISVQGGYDVNSGDAAHVITDGDGVFEQENGYTYFIDKPLQTPLQSVYSVLSSNPEFKAFFDLMWGFSETPSSNDDMFVRKRNYYGIDYNIKFFNTFNYTVYVPTNEAIEQAISDGLIMSWDSINAITDTQERTAAGETLSRFIRYHFQDNSVFLVDGQPVSNQYQTATINPEDGIITDHFGTYPNKFLQLRVNSDGQNMSVVTERLDTVNVLKTEKLYNMMTRDYIFNAAPSSYREIDGSGSGTIFTDSEIFTSSTAVVHQIDNVLRFE